MIRILMIVIACIAALTAACGSPETGNPSVRDSSGAAAPDIQMDWKALDQAMGRAGTMMAGNVYRFGMPGGDLQVTVAGVRVKPALALGSWIAFKARSGGAIAMGDLVLLESEVGPVLSRLQAGGIEQTAVHHHVLNETPRIVYVHIHAHGNALRIAGGVRE